jgi:hypothetical protein
MMHKEVTVCLAIALLGFGLQGCGLEEAKAHAAAYSKTWENYTLPNASAAYAYGVSAASAAASYMPNANMSVPGFLGNMSLASIASLPGMPVGHTCTDATTCGAMAAAAATNAAAAAQAAASVHAQAAVAAAANGGVLNATMSAAVAAADAAKAQAESASSMAEQATEAATVQAVEAAAVTTTTAYVGVPPMPAAVMPAAGANCASPPVKPGCVDVGALCCKITGSPQCAVKIKQPAGCANNMETPAPARLYAISGAITKYHAHAAVAVKAANYAVVSGGVVGLTALLTLLVLRIRNSAPIPAHEQDELLFGREERGEQINIE